MLRDENAVTRSAQPWLNVSPSRSLPLILGTILILSIHPHYSLTFAMSKCSPDFLHLFPTGISNYFPPNTINRFLRVPSKYQTFPFTYFASVYRMICKICTHLSRCCWKSVHSSYFIRYRNTLLALNTYLLRHDKHLYLSHSGYARVTGSPFEIRRNNLSGNSNSNSIL